jgi:GAF domain-containing protein
VDHRTERHSYSWPLGAIAGTAPPWPVFDHLAKVARQHFHVPVALVALTMDDRRIYAGGSGADILGLSREHEFCAGMIAHREVFMLEDARCDRSFADHPLVIGAPYVRFFASAPMLLPDGVQAGVVCILDSVPRSLNFAQKLVLQHLAGIAAEELLRLAQPAATHLSPMIRHAEPA